MNVLALVPARGGSKGIHKKNLQVVGGKSLVGWSVSHALKSALVNRVIVSSDDQDVIAEAQLHGAEVPFTRPINLAGDDVLDLPVFVHALNWLETNEGWIPDLVVHLRPTTPFREPSWIDEMINLLVNNSEADAVRSVSLVNQHPYRVFEIGNNGFLEPVMSHRHPNPALLRRQDHPPMYFYNCVIDVTRTKTIEQKNSMTGDRLLPWIMNHDNVIDIDTKADLEYAQWFFNYRNVK
jgi:CMP-N,N'-diacetyllegionaminic acid synthase